MAQKGGIKNFGVEGAGGGGQEKNYGFQKYTPPPIPLQTSLSYHITISK